MHDILTLREVSELTGLSEGALRMRRLRGMAPESFKIGVAVVYERAEVDTFLATLDESEAS